ncbi:hypothetical protein CDEST_09330 [Colletotrichum destructivum]|uniref:Uncharacterized protein n=1 Tax=Colletotrichum destructivum TaxID=34406 RepID=A0AAX4IMG8_9PEZI|nr:hypothetical protein CDEST_09330 [Colletotrichum destructivum]
MYPNRWSSCPMMFLRRGSSFVLHPVRLTCGHGPKAIPVIRLRAARGHYRLAPALALGHGVHSQMEPVRDHICQFVLPGGKYRRIDWYRIIPLSHSLATSPTLKKTEGERGGNVHTHLLHPTGSPARHVSFGHLQSIPKNYSDPMPA